LSNLNRFSKFLHCWNTGTSSFDINRLTLGMLPHYLGKLKIQIFGRNLADMEENANKLHFKCTDFNSSKRVTV